MKKIIDNKFIYTILIVFICIVFTFQFLLKEGKLKVSQKIENHEKNNLTIKRLDNIKKNHINKIEKNIHYNDINTNTIKNTIKSNYNLQREELILKYRRVFKGFLNNKNKKLRKLYKSIFNNDYKLILELNKEGVDFKKFKKNKKFFLLMSGYFTTDFRILDILLLQGFLPIDKKKSDSFESALMSKNFAFLEYLINNKDIDINYTKDKYSLKMQAFGNKDLEEWVTKFGGEYNDYDRANFYKKIGAYLIDKNNIEKYMNEGFEFSDKELSALLLKASYIKENALETLDYIKSLSTNLNKNIRNKAGETPLLSAIGSINNFDSVKWFVENDYDLYTKNKYGENSLSRAIRMKRENVIIYLLENNMDPSSELKVRGKRHKIKNIENLSGKKRAEAILNNIKYDTKDYKNLYEASKKEELINVQKYLETNYAY